MAPTLAASAHRSAAPQDLNLVPESAASVPGDLAPTLATDLDSDAGAGLGAGSGSGLGAGSGAGSCSGLGAGSGSAPAPAPNATPPLRVPPITSPVKTQDPRRDQRPNAPGPRDDPAAAVAAAEAELDARLARRLPRWHELVPPDRYRYDVDRQRRFVFASTLDESSHARFRREAEAIIDRTAARLFGGVPAEPVLVVASDGQRDARALIGPGAHVGGKYVHVDRILAVREIGVSLRHELVHAMHFGHMERMKMRTAHAFWIQEGLAALYETVAPDGTIESSDRDHIVHRRARGRREAIERLATGDGRSFMADARRNYAIARGFVRWLDTRGQLDRWYAELGDGSADPSGLDTAARVLGVEREDLAAEFRAWAREAAPDPVTTERGGPWLGIGSVNAADPDAVRVAGIVRRGPAAAAGLRNGDEILELDGRVVPTEAELDRLVNRRKPGDSVQLVVRRRGERLELALTLGRFSPPGG
ncbi:MAG: S1C family serine protease [Phycisphaerales bacterium]